MKTLVKTLLVSVLAIAMSFTPEALNAQARRSATGTSGSSATRSSNTSVSSTRESGASSSSVSRSSSSTRSSAATVSRSSAAATQGSSASRSSSSAVQSGQNRRSSTTGTSGSGSDVSRSSGSSVSRSSGSTSTAAPQSGTTRRSSATTATRNSSANTSGSGSNASGTSTTTRRSSSGTVGREATSINSADLGKVSGSRRSANATASKGLTTVKENANVGTAASSARISNLGGRNSNMRLDNHEVLRIPPRERDRIMVYDAPAHFYTHDPHYFGYRIQALPPRPHKMVHWGVTYYYYNNVYYRPWGSVYVVCRPPFGVVIERAMVSAALRDLRFAYYHNAYYTYREIDANYRTIDEQNRIIARNNATIAAQNAAMALNANRAYSAYELANQLGLVQSYANAATKYYYEDGVFFVVNARGQYEVIVPPAGALVSELPDDYETLVMNGIEYYMVDNTVYRVTLVDGTPYLEVLGQMPSKVAQKYGYKYY